MTSPSSELWGRVEDARSRRDVEGYLASLDDWRMELLGAQLSYCFENEFYGSKMRAAGISDPRDVQTMAEFRSLPAFMTKASHRQSQDESREKYGHSFGLHLCCPLDEVIHVAGTSGTTGLPTFYLFTRRDLKRTYDVLGRTFRFAGIRPGESVLVLYGLSMWVAGTTTIQALEDYGARPIPLGAEAGIGKALQYIDLCRPRVLFGTPSIMDRLITRAREVLGRELNECGIEIVVAGGEPGLAIPNVRKRLADGTGARLYDTTAGAWLNAAMDCGGDRHHGLHYLADDRCFRYDLVDPETGDPVPLRDGAEGAAIHTGLLYEAAPALRYATGDILRLHVGECPNCGFFGSRFEFLGRSDDLMNVAGVKVYPDSIRAVVESFYPEVPGRMEIVLAEPPPRVSPPVVVRVEAAPGAAPSDQTGTLGRRIQDRIHSSLKIRSEVTIVERGSLPESSLKTKIVRIEHR